MSTRAMPSRERGAFLIVAAVFVLIVLAFLGSVFLSTLTTSTTSSQNELQSTRAFAVAEGGLAFNQRALAMDLNWYLSTADPVATNTRPLGQGTFTATTTIPATELRTRIPTAVSTAPIRVYTTNRFPNAGVIQVEDDITGTAEFIQYTSTAGDTFAGTITRDVTVGGISAAAGPSPHARGERVYPVTTLAEAMANNCSPLATLRLAYHPKLLGAGTLDIQGEEVSYAGAASAGGVLTLSGVQRCQNGTVSAAYAIGSPVTPMLPDGASPDFEAEITSAGTIAGAARTARKTVQR
jgi:Tfp pilus assembly protein PilX